VAKTGRRKPVSPEAVAKRPSARGRRGHTDVRPTASGKGRKTTTKGAGTSVKKDDTPTAARAKETAANRRRPALDIPALDLSEQLLADQRKNASCKRVGPGPSAKPSFAPVASEETAPAPAAAEVRPPKPSTTDWPEETDIIADIVRRDIKRLRGGH